VTPRSDLRNSNYWVTEETTKGFRIVINPIYNEDLDFSWQAVAVKEFTGQVAGAQETAATILGCTDGAAINFSPIANQDDGSCIYEQTVVVEDDGQPIDEPETGSEEQATSTEPAISDPASATSTPDQLEPVLEDAPEESAPVEPDTISGCTDSSATNYNDLATEDDGSCQYPEPAVQLPDTAKPPTDKPVVPANKPTASSTSAD